MKKTILALIMLLTACMAQAADINGILLDANDTTALIGASVKLVKASKDSTLVKGAVTDVNGLFNLKGIKAGKYVLKLSYVGYKDEAKHIAVGEDGRNVNLGVIKLTPNSVMLQEAVVMGVKTPITVKEDTVEYNADSYKTQANAVVEDLLKRMPGVEVGSDGKITANGKEVKKILVDGKEFFADDPKMATKNLPANMVNKLQVIDRKSDLARLTGVDDGEDETVINLTVKKGMNNGWFGTVNAGYGTDNRYTGNLIANYFADGNQFTITGGGNNVNNMNFTDGGASRFQRMFGGNSGITTSQNLGFNFNVGTKDSEKFRAGGNLNYSHTSRDSYNRTSRQYLFPDSTSFYNSESFSHNSGHNFRGDFRIKWEVDSFNTLEIRPNFSMNFSNSEKSDSSFTRAGDAARTPVNKSLSYGSNDGKSYEFGGQIVYNHKFTQKRGRAFSFFGRYSYSNVDENGTTNTHNKYYLKEDPDETIDQVYDNKRITNGVNGRLSWTEPIGDIKNANFLQFSYSGSFRHSTSDKMVYDLLRNGIVTPAPVLTPDSYGRAIFSAAYDPNVRQAVAEHYGSDVLYDLPMLSNILDYELGADIERAFNEQLSNRFRNNWLNNSIEVGFNKTHKMYNLNVGVSVTNALSSSKDLINPDRNIAARWVWSFAPFARFNYKFSKTRNLNVNYRMRSNQPSLTQLQPVADVSNPLNIVIGNPELKSSFGHRLNMRFSDFAQERQRSFMLNLNADWTQNSIINKVTFDPTTGGRITTYENVNGVWNAMLMNMVSMPFGSSKTWFFSSHAFMRLSQTQGYNNGTLNSSKNFSLNLAPGLAFRNNQFDIELRPRYGYQTTHNSVTVASNRNIHTYGAIFNGTWSSLFGLVISTDLNFSATSGYTNGYDTKQWRWNGSVSYQFLRDRAAAFTLSVFDILGQTKNINRNVTANYIEDTYNNALGRYGMATFTYKFTTFKKGEQPKDQNSYEGFGPDGRRMGPPPGEGGRPGGMGGGRPGGMGGPGGRPGGF
ncbi:MAG: outer membrane beta-barrel protein [Muribaculaceae bacterium]|nr:outer membrane beta-barrel protein [Muribaculaceae bacterium]